VEAPDEGSTIAKAAEEFNITPARRNKIVVHEKSVSFWLDDASKTVTLDDGTALIVTRFDDNWISAKHGGISYEFDRRRHSLSYASSIQLR
jgi:hypothetical protein